MSEKKISPMLKLGLELGPVIAFFIAYSKLRDDILTIGGTDYSGFIVVTAAFVPLMVLSTLVLWKLTGTLSKMQLVTVVLVVVFGGMSVWFNDERFFKMKPTLIYLLFAGVLGFGLLRGKTYVKSLMGEMLPLQDEGWVILTKRMATFFLVLAILNEAIWRSMSTDIWVYFKTFGLSAAIFVFFMSQTGVFKKYAIEPEDANS